MWVINGNVKIFVKLPREDVLYICKSSIHLSFISPPPVRPRPLEEKKSFSEETNINISFILFGIVDYGHYIHLQYVVHTAHLK